jgi:hypothetical protein
MSVDNWLRNLLFTRFRIGKISFDFLEGLLAVCITGVGFLLRTPFENGMPSWPYLLVEWYLAIASAALVAWCGAGRRRVLGIYGILLILPTMIADGTLLREDQCVGALLLISALLFWKLQKSWLSALTLCALLLLDVKYIGILPFVLVLWQKEKVRSEQMLLLLAAGAARFGYSYRLWLRAGYTLTTFHWPNIYEIVGVEAVQGQLIDPIALVGLFLSLGLLVLLVWLASWRKWKGLERIGETDADTIRVLLFFLLVCGYFLPYMDQGYGYLPCIVSVIYVMLVPKEFPVAFALQIVTFAGYQECLNGESMMPMVVFAVLQFLVIAWLALQIFDLDLWKAGIKR